jgi:hypothetical protein
MWWVIVLVFLVLLFITCLVLLSILRRQSWPFKALRRKGQYRNSCLPTSGDAFTERKRDFARTTKKSGNGLFVVSPAVSSPTPWSNSQEATSAVDTEAVDAVFDEFSVWLHKQVDTLSKTLSKGLAERVVANVAASEGFTFAMQHSLAPMFPQSKFVLVFGAQGQVRVMWVAFITPEVKPNLTHTPFILKVLTEDLNSEHLAEAADESGINMDYVVVRTSAKSLDDYIKKEQVSALSRASVEDCWDDVLKSA